MTDPTADAIAALTPFADEADKRVAPGASIKHLPDEWPIGGSALTYGDLRRAREVRSALLSAQGQAGKSVAESSAEIAALKAERDRWETACHANEAQTVEMGEELATAESALDDLTAAIKTKGGTEHYPTEDAYLAACRALEKHRKRADDAEAQLTTARTALEAAEKALGPFSKAADELPKGWFNVMPVIVTAADVDAASTALSAVLSALATITEKDDGHGRG